MAKDYQVGCYYFPGYHPDPRNETLHGAGWTEWNLVRQATPRFKGHRQPLIPLWGYQDEADPRVMEQKIDAAADHGLDFWIFDWYWYDDGPFLQRCLEQGYLKAKNNRRIKFCCMWANHDWINIHPARPGAPPLPDYHGVVTPKTWKTLTKHVISRYFNHPSYFTVENAPYFSFYDLQKLVESFGSLRNTRTALDFFRTETRRAGFPSLHLNAVVWGQTILPGEKAPVDSVHLVKALGFDSVTSYVWVHHVGLPKFPTNPYARVRDAYLKYWDDAKDRFGVPYFPNVTMGWDSSPRTIQSDVWVPRGYYPYGNRIGGNTPKAFCEALRVAKRRLDRQGGPKILNINAWNEWTEGSYLEPDTVSGMKYLEAIKKVFGA